MASSDLVRNIVRFVTTLLMKSPRNFANREPNEQRWLTENTWCDACGTADLGLTSPQEYEEDGRVFVVGNCARCGATVTSEVTVREANP